MTPEDFDDIPDCLITGKPPGDSYAERLIVPSPELLDIIDAGQQQPLMSYADIQQAEKVMRANQTSWPIGTPELPPAEHIQSKQVYPGLQT